MAITDFINSEQKTLVIKFNTIYDIFKDKDEKVPHRTPIGSFAESLLKGYIKEKLGNIYHVKQGFLFKSSRTNEVIEEYSNQCDILLFKTGMTPIFTFSIENTDFVLANVNNALFGYIIEVKATDSNWEDHFRSTLSKDFLEGQIRYALVIYRSDKDSPDYMGKMNKISNELNKGHHKYGVFILSDKEGNIKQNELNNFLNFVTPPMEKVKF